MFRATPVSAVTKYFVKSQYYEFPFMGFSVILLLRLGEAQLLM